MFSHGGALGGVHPWAGTHPDEVAGYATPTVMMVNSRGAVTDIWTGQLPRDREEEVFSKL
jgi:hypothetical protein